MASGGKRIMSGNTDAIPLCIWIDSLKISQIERMTFSSDRVTFVSHSTTSKQRKKFIFSWLDVQCIHVVAANRDTRCKASKGTHKCMVFWFGCTNDAILHHSKPLVLSCHHFPVWNSKNSPQRGNMVSWHSLLAINVERTRRRQKRIRSPETIVCNIYKNKFNTIERNTQRTRMWHSECQKVMCTAVHVRST